MPIEYIFCITITHIRKRDTEDSHVLIAENEVSSWNPDCRTFFPFGNLNGTNGYEHILQNYVTLKHPWHASQNTRDAVLSSENSEFERNAINMYINSRTHNAIILNEHIV